MSRTPRAAAAVGLTALLTAALAGCEQPTPSVSVFSGKHSVHSQAQCYARGGSPVTPQECAKQSRAVPKLAVAAGETIGIDVDRELADGQWIAAINGQRLSAQLVEGHYFKFALGPEALAQAPLELQVIARGDDKQNKGVWVFELTRAGS